MPIVNLPAPSQQEKVSSNLLFAVEVSDNLWNVHLRTSCTQIGVIQKYVGKHRLSFSKDYLGLSWDEDYLKDMSELLRRVSLFDVARRIQKKQPEPCPIQPLPYNKPGGDKGSFLKFTNSWGDAWPKGPMIKFDAGKIEFLQGDAPTPQPIPQDVKRKGGKKRAE